ncbi:hypothetical protein DEJ21_14640 [Curtobacterium sp. MCSS17_006]|nr:hypothetical protein DEJ21_14640 [Curtobacterium sp. MCSS17_006]
MVPWRGPGRRGDEVAVRLVVRGAPRRRGRRGRGRRRRGGRRRGRRGRSTPSRTALTPPPDVGARLIRPMPTPRHAH